MQVTVEGAMTGKSWALAAAAGAITMTLIGGGAVAGVQPFGSADPVTRSTLNEPGADVTQQDSPLDTPKDRLKATLDALVKKGTITQAQEDSILKALNDATPPARPARPAAPNVRAFIGDLTRAAHAYLGLAEKDLAAQLRAGKSVADIANGVQGKSSAELVTVLTKTATDRVDQAVANRKLTPEQASELKPKIAAEISAFVQRSFAKPAPRPLAPARPSPSPRP